MHSLGKQFITEDEKNKSLFIEGIINGDKRALELLKEKFNQFLFKIYFISYINKSIKLKSREIKRKRNKLNEREHLYLNTYDDNFKEERINIIQGKDIDFVEEISKPKEIDFLTVFSDEKFANTMNQLTKRQKQIIFMKYIEDKDEDQISMELQVTSQAVNKVKNAALKKIRKLLGGDKSGRSL